MSINISEPIVNTQENINSLIEACTLAGETKEYTSEPLLIIPEEGKAWLFTIAFECSGTYGRGRIEHKHITIDRLVERVRMFQEEVEWFIERFC